jgi:hypothetical protein
MLWLPLSFGQKLFYKKVIVSFNANILTKSEVSPVFQSVNAEINLKKKIDKYGSLHDDWDAFWADLLNLPDGVLFHETEQHASIIPASSHIAHTVITQPQMPLSLEHVS